MLGFIDYVESKSNMEDKADNFASNSLINEDDYNEFMKKNNLKEEEIIKFAKTQKVQPFIVVGRMQKETNNFKFCYKLKTRYKWEKN